MSEEMDLKTEEHFARVSVSNQTQWEIFMRSISIPALYSSLHQYVEVDAKQNRHQFRLAVASVDVIANRVAGVHGEVINEGEENGRKLLGVRDPDGNTYELVEAM
jgi:hypothetical protein